MWSSDSSDEDEVVVRRPRVFKERINYDFMQNNNYEYNERFRLNAEKIEILIGILGPRLARNTNRNQSLSVELQIQTALHWLGTGAQYHAISDMSGISKASVCRVVKEFVRAVNEGMFANIVKWPENVGHVVQQFFDISGFPMVCGVVDGTLIKIDAPTENEDMFVDRHSNHSINCMVVCGADLNFYYSYANWPGSTHDARVLRNSGLFQRMEAGWRPIADGILLGDSGYPLKDWLIVPVVPDPNERGSRRFLRVHKSTRRIVENALGVLKEKFPCLNYLRVSPEFACQVFNCCVALCNFSRGPNDEPQPEHENYEVLEMDEVEGEDEVPDAHGVNRLQRILEYFR